MILAGIDIGTNTLRLLIAEAGPDSFHELYSGRKITRLGQGLERTGCLSREAVERSVRALLDFTEQIGHFFPHSVCVIGTSALRNASNSSAFLEEVKDRTGLDVSVISGEEEARLTLMGVTRAVSAGGTQKKSTPLDNALVVDIGGGSTEIITMGSHEPPIIVSLPLGAVYLTEQFIRHDPPSREEIDYIRQGIMEVLESQAGTIKPGSFRLFIGTAGTITTLAAIDQGLVAYDPARINRSVLTRETLDEIIKRLGTSTLAERRTIRGLEKGREDIILAGDLITQEIMKKFG